MKFVVIGLIFGGKVENYTTPTSQSPCMEKLKQSANNRRSKVLFGKKPTNLCGPLLHTHRSKENAYKG